MIVQAPHSADVHLNLYANSEFYPLSKIGRNEIFFRDPVTIPAGVAEVIMTVDGREHRWKVELVHGAVPFDDAVVTRHIDE